MEINQKIEFTGNIKNLDIKIGDQGFYLGHSKIKMISGNRINCEFTLTILAPIKEIN